MNEFLNELTKWLEANQREELARAEDCNAWAEVSEEDALKWCANAYDVTLDKIKELRKKYKV